LNDFVLIRLLFFCSFSNCPTNNVRKGFGPSLLIMSCQFPGTPDMYGQGIRVGFYTLWFSTELATWLARPLLPALRFLLPLFTAAAFLGLVIRTAWQTLLPVEVYVVLLLVSGTYYCWLPFYAWRLATGCSPYWDPSRWPLVAFGRVWLACHYLLMLAATAFQVWFWCTGLGALPLAVGPNALQPGCQQWGYFLAMVPLDAAVYIAFNLLFVFVLLLCAFVSLLFLAGVLRPPRYLRKQARKADKRGIS
jgi:hypothetical protein